MKQLIKLRFEQLRDLIRRYILPQSLFARIMLAFLTPVFLLQTSVLLIFFDRPWEDLSEQLIRSVVREVRYVTDTLDRLTPQEHAAFFSTTSSAFNIRFRFAGSKEAITDAPPPSFIANALHSEMSARFGEKGYQAYFRREESSADLVIPTPHGLLVATVPLKRLFSSSINFFALAFVSLTLLLFAASMIVLRNQIKPIRRLATLAHQYGKGLPTPDIQLGGATEVRQAAHAFRTMRRRIDQQIRQRTVMLAGVSHDLRTPLTKMKLEIEFLGDKNQEVAAGMHSDIDAMEKMIGGYLDFARGQASIAPERLNLIDLVDEVVASMGKQVAAQNQMQKLDPPFKLTFHPPTGFKSDLTNMLTRKLSVQRVLENLIGNALKYGHSICDVFLHSKANGTVEISVEDDGLGIPHDQRDSAMQPFVQLDPSGAASGVGLGLATTRDTLVSLGGDLHLEVSRYGGLKARAVFPF